MILKDITPLTETAYDSPSDDFKAGVEWVIGIIDNLPTLDYVPQVHARWSKNNQCSACKEYDVIIAHDFCPHCGAKMDADKLPLPPKRLAQNDWYTCPRCDCPISKNKKRCTCGQIIQWEDDR